MLCQLKTEGLECQGLNENVLENLVDDDVRQKLSKKSAITTPMLFWRNCGDSARLSFASPSATKLIPLYIVVTQE